jgi:hypothetical protein
VRTAKLTRNRISVSILHEVLDSRKRSELECDAFTPRLLTKDDAAKSVIAPGRIRFFPKLKDPSASVRRREFCRA